jgi:hypothetical protein
MIIDAGIMGVFAMVASFVLVFGSKWLGSAVVSRPAGTRPGELGDPRDDLLAAPADARPGEVEDA